MKTKINYKMFLHWTLGKELQSQRKQEIFLKLHNVVSSMPETKEKVSAA